VVLSVIEFCGDCRCYDCVSGDGGEESVVMEASRPVIALESQAVVVGAVEGRLVVGTLEDL
jgi:hypothetical protein